MKPAVLSYPGNEGLARALAQRIEGDLGNVSIRPLPDGETYVQIDVPVATRKAILVCSLDHPDTKLLPLLFAAAAAGDCGASSVGLVAPYLPYLRRDRVFERGESAASRCFGKTVSGMFDWIVTVDPHLDRDHPLKQAYGVPVAAVQAAPEIAAWIRTNVERPLVVHPDRAASRWLVPLAEEAGAPYLVLDKMRQGEEVRVYLPDVERWRKHTPVLVDDTLCTAQTVIETADQFVRAGLSAPVVVGVHAVFAAGAYEGLSAKASRVVTCNTIPHASNAIDLSGPLAEAVHGRWLPW